MGGRVTDAYRPVVTELGGRPRVLVIGLGGIGGIISAHLAEQGHRVVGVSSNPAIRDAVAQDGLWVTGDGETRVVPAEVVPVAPAGGGFDYVFLCTQPPQVEDAARGAVGSLSDAGVFVVFQNGLCEDRVADLSDPSRVVGAVVAWGASMLGPGRYQRTSAGGFTIGRLTGKTDSRDEVLATLLECIGPVQMTDNLRGARWSKLALNCAISTLGTVGGARLGGLLTHRFVRRLGLEIMTEAVDVARAEGVRLQKVAGTLDLETLALTEAEKRASGSAALVGKHAVLLAVGARYRRLRSSMLAAIERGRRPAVDFLNGEIVTRAERHGVDAPVNACACRTVHQIAAGERRPGMDLLRSVYDRTRPPN